jgi:hypothetical protein
VLASDHPPLDLPKYLHEIPRLADYALATKKEIL